MGSYYDFKQGDVRILIQYNSEGPRPDYVDYCSMYTLSGLNLVTPETWADFWVQVRPVADQTMVRSVLCLFLIGSAVLLTAAAILLDDSDPDVLWIFSVVLFCVLMIWSWRKSMIMDEQIQKICKDFSTRFEADGFSVDYRHESSPWGDLKYIQFRHILP